MGIENEILNSLPRLSKSKRKVAEYILQNPNKVIKMKIAQLAQAADSSSATVVRLVKDLELESFTALKIELSASLSKRSLGNKSYGDISANEALDSIKQKLLANAQRSISETVEQIDEKEIKEAVKLLNKCKQMVIFGVGASGLVAENIAQKWSRLGYLTIAENNLNSLLPKLVGNQADTLVWLVSNSGESPEVVNAAIHASERNFPLVSLTRRGDSLLDNYVKTGIHTAFPRESKYRIAATSSLLAQFTAVDIVFYYFVSQNFSFNVKLLSKSYDIVAKYKKELNYRK
ncbi:MurR/RpiR family transcriptional regulator [Liquorilactobacillus mali]|uniref:MurR/RpiR family transcriptional regulator n=1 Tax=Liquorilactobacillus mali TaxID=1618 RepID=UPI00234FF882|nr:MurR/RpiR family transcriptional regulator [Liquorilactobacillus mali]MDC7952486.1 MurR/RpiR family transcriptional regulator [Liquorilactobacillus mali]